MPPNLRSVSPSLRDPVPRAPVTAANDRRISDKGNRNGVDRRAPRGGASARASSLTPVDAATGKKPLAERSRTLLVVDAACDMPTEWLAENNIAVLPIKASVDDWELLDTHNEFDTMEFFRKDLSTRGARASTTPLSSIETREFIQSNLNDNTDYVLQLTIAAGRSKIYMNSLSAMHALTAAHNRVRRGIGNREPFKTWVIDSETGFTGQAVLLYEANRQLNAGVSAPKVAERMERTRHQVHAFMVPKDLFYLYKRAREKGDDSLSWLSYNVARALDIKPIIHAHGGVTAPVLKVRGHFEALERVMGLAMRHVKGGLTVPVVCVSYAGNLEDIRTTTAYRDLRDACQFHNTDLILSTMSMTGGLNVGADAFAIGFACKALDLT
jgi:DegV family protein with EDD domain